MSELLTLQFCIECTRCSTFLSFFLFFKFYFIFKLYIIVLVLPNIKMNPPQVFSATIYLLIAWKDISICKYHKLSYFPPCWGRKGFPMENIISYINGFHLFAINYTHKKTECGFFFFFWCFVNLGKFFHWDQNNWQHLSSTFRKVPIGVLVPSKERGTGPSSGEILIWYSDTLLDKIPYKVTLLKQS